MENMHAHRIVAVLFVWSLAAGCGPASRGGGGGGGGGGVVQCPQGCTQCDMAGKCHDCTPGGTICRSDAVMACNPDGTIGAQVKQCDGASGEHCAGTDCLSACEVAASSHSYIGCDYWPTTTLTSQLNPYFDFAVAVANPLQVGDVTQSAPAQITITLGAKVVAQKTVAPGAVETIILPWVTALSQTPDCTNGGNCTSKNEASALVPSGAYHLVSTIPVTVYQFSPLQFEKKQTSTCIDPDPVGNVCHSYSNDASILLPSTALKNEYIVISRETFSLDDGFGSATPIPGFFAVVGTADGTNVMITSSAYTEAGKNAPAMTPGQTQSFLLNKGDVLQLVSKRATSPCAAMSTDQTAGYCDLGKKYDLTGSHVVADQPVVVYGGHACSFVPYNKWACDHLEEQLTPLDTWGQKIAVAPTKPYTNAKEPNVWRIVSGTDGNAITFDPPAAHAPVTLDAGQYVEFTTGSAFQASGTGRLAIGQFMVGENYINMSMQDIGDPSLGLGVPVEQWRDNYDFLSPSTYTDNYVIIIGPTDAQLMLDGADINFKPTSIGGTGLGFQYVTLKPGAHHLTGSAKFGISVTGIANYTSYLFVGGQDLKDVPLQ